MIMIPWTTRIGVILLCGFMAWLLAGCSSDTDSDDDADLISEKSESVDVLYNRALVTFEGMNYKKAIQEFEEVERQHPYSDWAKKSQVMAAYAAYRAQEYDEAAVILERFVKLHPNNENTPYAYYLRALCYYDQISDVGRDQKMTQDAKQALREVVSRFPDTDYARDARIKLDLTEDHLAGKEMEIGRYYMARQEWLAAINRFQYVLDHHQTTSHVPEALHRLVEAYLQLGVKEEANKYAAVLGHNYPGSEWYQFSYKMLHGDMNPEADTSSKNSDWWNVF